MLAQKFAEDTELPHVGSIGFTRGTAQRARVLRRNGEEPGKERTCLVQLYQKLGAVWVEVRGSSGNTEIEERDLYPTKEAALFPAGRPARRTRSRRA